MKYSAHVPHRSIIGFDLGGTKSAIARYDEDTWEIEAQERLPTHADRGFSHVLKDVLMIIERLRVPETRAIGIGVPGLVRQPDGVLLRAPNIPHSEHVPLKETLEEALKLPVFVDNDANCFALAEALSGAGKGHRIVVGITMGTGVGGGIVIDGNIFHGEHGYAAELGHMLLQPGHPPYRTSDQRGDAEQFLSGTALRKRCEEAKRPEDYLEGEVCAFLHEEIFREAAWLCANLTHVLDPGIIVFGGSTGRALKPHLSAVQRELKEWLLPETPLPPLTVSTLSDAATLGAALLAHTYAT